MVDELNQADRDAMLIIEAFALGQSNPAVWDAFMEGWTNDVFRRINSKFGTEIQPPPRDPGASDGGDGTGAESSEADSNG